MKVVIETKNPGKIEGAKKALEHYFNDFEIIGIPVSSNVSDEPVNEETYTGAKNRVDNLIKYAKENNIEADYYMAVESGIINSLGKWSIINIAVVKDKDDYESWGNSMGFPVPDKYVKDIIENELGPVMDKIFNKTDLRSGTGGINILTNNVVSRIDMTESAFIMALTQFINANIWSDKDIEEKGSVKNMKGTN